MEGWIKIHREIRSHWIWDDPLYFRAWIWFLMRANHDDTKVLMGSTLVDVNRGQFITSIRKIAGDTGLTEQRVRTLLSLLIRDEMINTVTTSKLTQITISQYDDYQNVQQTNNTRSNKPATTEKNVKKKENKRKYIYSEFYDEQISLENDGAYSSFIAFLFGENPTEKPLLKVLKLKDQILPKQFKTLMKKFNKDLIKEKLLAMENSDKLSYTSAYLTLNTWCRMEVERKGKRR